MKFQAFLVALLMTFPVSRQEGCEVQIEEIDHEMLMCKRFTRYEVNLILTNVVT